MDDEIQERIRAAHFELPEACRAAPATEDQLRAFEAQFGAIPPDYRWYLGVCGGGVVGAEWVDDICDLWETHERFHSEPWNMKHVFVIGWDGGGNPYGIENTTGRIIVEDHDFGASMRWHRRFPPSLKEAC